MKYRVTLNNKIYEVEVEAGEAILIDEYEACAPAPQTPAAAPAAPVPAAVPAPAAPAVTAAGEAVTSPMPGNILDVKVKQGEKVKAGQIVMILEAMKMENEVVAPQDGTIAQIVTAKGSTVNTGDTLFVIA